MSTAASSVDADAVTHAQVQDEQIQQLQQKLRTLEESIASTQQEHALDNDDYIKHLTQAVAEENIKHMQELDSKFSELHGMVENAKQTSLESQEQMQQLVSQMTASALPSGGSIAGSIATHYDSSDLDAEEAGAALPLAADVGEQFFEVSDEINLAVEEPSATQAQAADVGDPFSDATNEMNRRLVEYCAKQAPAAGAAEAPAANANVAWGKEKQHFAAIEARGSGMSNW